MYSSDEKKQTGIPRDIQYIGNGRKALSNM